MRVLRSSCFVDMVHPPLTTVVRDKDIRDTLESAAISSQQPGTLVVHDIFEMPDHATIQHATRKAMQRIDLKREQNMAVLFFWSLGHFRLLTKGGTLFMDKPAPLTPEDIRYVFEQLKVEPSYNDFRLTSIAYTGERVRLVEGEIK